MRNKEHYDRLSGLIEFREGKPYWVGINSKFSNVSIGDLAGRLSIYGYREVSISIGGHAVNIKAHRINFYMVHGYLPKEIDHIDRDKDNNDIDNLRACTTSQNGANKKKRSGCSSQYKGVCKHGGRWQASIRLKGKSTHLGMFIDESDAALAYDMAAISEFGEFASLNFRVENKLNRVIV